MCRGEIDAVASVAFRCRGWAPTLYGSGASGSGKGGPASPPRARSSPCYPCARMPGFPRLWAAPVSFRIGPSSGPSLAPCQVLGWPRHHRSVPPYLACPFALQGSPLGLRGVVSWTSRARTGSTTCMLQPPAHSHVRRACQTICKVGAVCLMRMAWKSRMSPNSPACATAQHFKL